MNITDNRTLVVEIDGHEHLVTLSELQRLYDLIGGVMGIRRHGGGVSVRPYWDRPWTYTSGIPTTTLGSSTVNPGRISISATS